jgi:SAM-dependent methyltransferase
MNQEAASYLMTTAIAQRAAAPLSDVISDAEVAEVLTKVGVDELFASRLRGLIEARLPPGAAAYLRADNPRLLALRSEYRQLRCPVLNHSQWTERYVTSQVPLQAFRGDCGYVYQHRDMNLPVTYLLTFYYLQTDGKLPLIDRLDEDELFGAYVLEVAGRKISRDRLDSACEISFIKSALRINRRRCYRIFDIGSGYGRLAHRLVQAMDNIRVTCVDAVPESTFICDYYLKFRKVHARAETISLPDFIQMYPQCNFDLAVNIHSFSECTTTAVAWWLHILRQMKVPRLMIVPNGDGGGRLLTTETDRSRNDFEQLIVEHGYQLVRKEPKYAHPLLQRYGVTPTTYFLFELWR